jgi:hypothetical protein
MRQESYEEDEAESNNEKDDAETLEEIIASDGILAGYVDKDGRILVAYQIGRRRVG